MGKRETANDASELRSRAEEEFNKQQPGSSILSTIENTKQLIDKLESQQAKLELQNEELRKARLVTEEALSKYSNLYDFAPVGYITLDLRGVITRANLQAAKMLGLERSRLHGRSLRQSVALPDRPVFDSFLGMILKGDKAECCSLAMIRAGDPIDASFVWLEGSIAQDGQELQVIMSDITRLRFAEDQLSEYRENLVRLVEERTADLSESEARCRHMIGSVTDYVFTVMLKKGRPFSTLHNDACLALTGYTPEEYDADDLLWLRMIHPDDRDAVVAQLQLVLAGETPQPLEHRIMHKDGSLRWVNNTSVPRVKDGLLVAYDGIITDITKRKKAELALRESENRYRLLYHEFSALLNSIDDVIFLLSPDLRIVWLNKAAEVFYGRPKNELINRPCYSINHNRAVHCEECRAVWTYMNNEMSQYRLTVNDRVLDMRSFPVSDDTGAVSSILLIGADITERLRMEESARRTYHLAQLGQLSAGMAHEINNPNNVILSSSQLLKDVWEDAAGLLFRYAPQDEGLSIGGLPFAEMLQEIPSMIAGITECSGRINSIVSHLRDYAGHQSLCRDEDVNINRVVSNALVIANSQIKSMTVSFRTELSGGLPSVKGNSLALEQVIINLVINALQSLTDKRCGVVVTTGFDGLNQCVFVQIKDEGCGMSEETLARIFTPFYTTKQAGGGIGLGLSISLSIVRNHNGSLTFASTLNRGTTATLMLPVPGKHQDDR